MSLFTSRKHDSGQSASTTLQLAVVVDGQLLRREDLAPGVWSIGSSPRADVVLPHASIRPIHAVLVFDGGVPILQVVADPDPNCASPTRINGREMQRTQLATGDVVELANFRLEVSLSAMHTDEATDEDLQPEVNPAANPTSTDPASTERMQTPAPRREGELRLFFELSWGDRLLYSRSFGRGAPIVAAADDDAQLPLWGFSLPEAEHVIATSIERGFEIRVPPMARAELRDADGNLVTRVDDSADVRLERGMSLLLAEGNMTLRVRAAPAERMPFVLPGRDLPWLAATCVALLSATFGYIVAGLPDEKPAPKLEPPRPQMVAVKLKPPPKPPEPVREAKRAPEPRQKVARHRSSDSTPQRGTLQGLSKLAAVSVPTDKLAAATSSLQRTNTTSKLAAVGGAPSLGNGPPVIGGTRGRGTSGAELLRGRVGALATHKIGRAGAVAGTVRRASPNRIAAKGSIDRDAVAKVVNAHLKTVQACYERALVKSPGLAGKVVLEWTISTDGSVTSARSKSSTLRSHDVEQCIVRELKGWKFPAASGGPVVITYPFLFNAVGF